jgi:aryl-alcohol dehydrogenase-like predicted oxidoreductase
MSTLQYRNLGNTGLKVSRICIGTMTYGSDEIDETDAVKIIESALNVGINFFDTADIYLDGRSEEIVGKALRKERHSAVIATKGGVKMGPGPNDMGLSRKHIIKAVEDSLRRLQTDYIDLYYVHMPDYNTPLEETIRALDDMIRQGKVRYIGCSNFRAWQLCKARSVSELHNLVRFECIQSPYNLLTRDIEMELLHYCGIERIGVTVYNPLAAGLLTGDLDAKKPPPKGTRFMNEAMGLGKLYRDRYWLDVNFEAIAQLKQIAQQNGRSLTQFALAWIFNNETITSVLCGITSHEQLETDINAFGLKLSQEELLACDDVWKRYFRPPRAFYGQ